MRCILTPYRATVCASFDDLVGLSQQDLRHGETERLGGLKLMIKSNFASAATGAPCSLVREDIVPDALDLRRDSTQ